MIDGEGGPAIYSWGIVYLRAGVLKRLFYNSISTFFWNDSFDSWKWFCTISGPFMWTIDVQRQLSHNTDQNRTNSRENARTDIYNMERTLVPSVWGCMCTVCITFIITYILFTFILIDGPLKTVTRRLDIIARPKNGGCAVGRGTYALNCTLRKSKQ